MTHLIFFLLTSFQAIALYRVDILDCECPIGCMLFNTLILKHPPNMATMESIWVNVFINRSNSVYVSMSVALHKRLQWDCIGRGCFEKRESKL